MVREKILCRSTSTIIVYNGCNCAKIIVMSLLICAEMKSILYLISVDLHYQDYLEFSPQNVSVEKHGVTGTSVVL